MIDGGEGVDTVSYEGSSESVEIDLAEGNYAGGDAEGDTIRGIENIVGSGNDDVLRGDGGDNEIEGGAGDDILEGGAGDDVIDGGAGRDTVSYEHSGEAVEINLGRENYAGGDAEGDTIREVENIMGSAYADTLTGDSGDNEIEGRGGADIIEGGAGFDTVSYENSAEAVEINLMTGEHRGGDARGDIIREVEYIKGSEYDDILIGNETNNRIEGGAGDDVLEGGAGFDTLDGGEGTDKVSYEHSGESVEVDLATGTYIGGDAEGDTIREIENIGGSRYDDILRGDGEDNMIEGGDGDDVLEGGAGADVLEGGEGIDTVSYENSSSAVEIDLATNNHRRGDAQGDVIREIENIVGSYYADTLIGDEEDNMIEGGRGNDILDGGLGADILDGGAGIDTVSYEDSGEAVEVDLGMDIHSGGDAEGDKIRDIQNIIGSDYGDVLVGDNEDNEIEGGEGADRIDGGAGIDTVNYENSDEAVEIDLETGMNAMGDAEGDVIVNVENIIGSDHADTIRGDGEDNRIEGESGADILEGGGGADLIDGGRGIDIVSYEHSREAVKVNLTTNVNRGGDAQGDTIRSVESIRGSAYDDTLVGNSQSNRIEGGDGDDIIEGGNGFDTLDGGEGIDTVSYESSNEAVEIDLAGDTHRGGHAEGDTISNIENIIGSGYNDILVGDDGDNMIEGGDGDDVIEGGLGADMLDGEDGVDTVSYENSSEAVEIDLAMGTYAGGDAQGDTIVNVENIKGSTYNDMLTGDDGDNEIEGGAGEDAIDGGDGVDTVSYENSSEGVEINLETGTYTGGDAEGDTISNVENIRGSANDDTLTGDDGDNEIEGGAGEDTIDGGDGVDTVSYENSGEAVEINLRTNRYRRGDAQGDTISNVENIRGSDHSDILRGDNGSNEIEGGAGADTIDGGGGLIQ